MTAVTLVGIAALVAGIAVLAVRVAGSDGSTTTTPQPSQLLAPVDTAATGATVDGIQCQSSEQVLFHIHAHLAVFVDGAARGIPAGIGIAPPRQVAQTDNGPFVSGGGCYYWLHAHTADGVIHIESPDQRTYTLGEWFDIWDQPLTASQVGPAHGTVIAYVDGKLSNGDPRQILLGAHTQVQLDVGKDTAPQPFTFPNGL